ncbi:MAG: hypothetical protein ABII79_10865 [bacterium]
MTGYTKSLLALVVSLIALQSVVIGVAGLDRPYWGDESHFVPTVREFGDEISLDRLKHYNEMSGPLPFVVYALWGRAFGFEIHVLRILSVIIALLTGLVFHRLLYTVTGKPMVSVLGAVFLAGHPYMVGFSIFVFTDMLPILLLILACLALVKHSAGAFALAAAGALLCRQYYIFLPLAAAAYALMGVIRGHESTGGQSAAQFAKRLLVAGLFSVVPLGLLFLLWQGVSPDNELRAHYLEQGLTFHLNYLVMYVCLLSIYLLPVVVARWRWFYRDRRTNVAALIVSWLYWLFPVTASPHALAIDVDTVGLFHRFLRWIGGSTFEQIVFYFGFLLGLPILIWLIRDCLTRIRRRQYDLPLFLDLAVPAFLVIMPFSYLCWEKYFLPMVPLLIVRLLHREAA